MMIKFNKKELLENYNKCKSAIKKSNVLPIFSSIRMIVDKNTYSIIAANGIYQITTSGSCESKEKIDVCIDSSKFGLMLSASAGEIVFEISDDEITAKSSKSKYKFKFLPGDDMPLVAVSEKEKIAIDLSMVMDGVYLNAQTSNVNQIFNGVSIDIGNGKICAYASDGHSMAFSEHDADTELLLKLIIPTEICAIVAANKCDYFYSDNRTITVVFEDGTKLISKLIDGNQPNYRNVIPVDDDMYFSVARKDLIDVVATCIKTEERSMSITVLGNNLAIKAGNNLFTFESEITAESNGDLKESFNPLMMQMLCKIITSETLKITYTTGNTKKYLCTDGDKTYLMMPLRS